MKKGALARNSESRHYRYQPLLTRREWLRSQTGSLVDTHCNGRLAPLVAAFVDAESISAEDRREILELLERLK